MVPEVTINAADLEALLFAAGAANASPEAKKILKRDPQFEQIEERLTDAVKRAGDSWRKANRAEEFPERFEVDKNDIGYLRDVAKQGGISRFGMVEPLGDTIPRSFITRMLLEYGIYSEVCSWSTSGDTDRLQHANRRVRLTADARKIIGAAAIPEPQPHQPVLAQTARPPLDRETTRLAQRVEPQKHDFGPSGEGARCLRCYVRCFDVEDAVVAEDCPAVTVPIIIAAKPDQG